MRARFIRVLSFPPGSPLLIRGENDGEMRPTHGRTVRQDRSHGGRASVWMLPLFQGQGCIEPGAGAYRLSQELLGRGHTGILAKDTADGSFLSPVSHAIAGPI